MSRPPKLAIDLVNRQRGVPLPRPLLRKAVRIAWGTESVAGRVVVAVVGDEEMTALNARFLDHHWPTDVLAFRYSPQEMGTDGIFQQKNTVCPHFLDGEIIVNAECARRESERRGHALDAELALYVAHGALHLIGYDDHDVGQRRRMRARERQVLKSLGLTLADCRGRSSEREVSSPYGESGKTPRGPRPGAS